MPNLKHRPKKPAPPPLSQSAIERIESDGRSLYSEHQRNVAGLRLGRLQRVVLTPTAIEHAAPQVAEIYKQILGLRSAHESGIHPIHASLRAFMAWTLWYRGVVSPTAVRVLNELAAILDVWDQRPAYGWPLNQQAYNAPVNPQGADPSKWGSWRGYRFRDSQ